MKASVSIINICSAGIKLILKRKKDQSRLFSSANILALPLSFPSVNDHEFLWNLKCISDECTDVHGEFSLRFDDNDDLIYKYNQKAEEDKLKRIKAVLKRRGWNLGSENNSDSMIALDQFNIIQILNDLFDESRDATLALYFFRWSGGPAGSIHSVKSICTMIRILVAGNMKHRAIDLILYLVRENDGEDWWCNLLLKVLHEARSERRVLVTVYSMLVDCYVKEHMPNVALKLISQMKHNDCFPSIGVCNSLLRTLLVSEQMDLAWEFLEEIQRLGLGFNTSILSLFIHKYCMTGNLESGWKLLMEMKKHGIKPDVVAYTILIDSLCKMFLLKEATSILFKMIQMGISLDSVSISSVIDGFCKARNMEKAMGIFEIFSLRPNIYVYNSFISTLCTDGNMATATKLFREMSILGLVPDCFNHTTIVGGYCKIGNITAALTFLGNMLKRGFNPSVTTYTALIDGYCKFGDLDSAEQSFHNMIRAKMVPDVVAYNTLMDGYGKKGQLHKAFGLLDIMKSSGISPDIVTYNIITHSLIARGYVNEAKDILDELIRRGLSPDIVTLTSLMSGYGKKGNFEETFLVWFYMSEHHMKPDVVTCSALLNGYCKAHRMEEANAFFLKMLDVGLVPDLILYNTLIHGFCSVGNIGDACDLICMMVEGGVCPNDVTHWALVLGYEKKWVRNPVETAAFKMQQILLKYGISIDIDHYLTSIQQPFS